MCAYFTHDDDVINGYFMVASVATEDTSSIHIFLLGPKIIIKKSTVLLLHHRCTDESSPIDMVK